MAMNIDSGSTPLVLLCPAWKRWGTAKTVKPGTVILHSRAESDAVCRQPWNWCGTAACPESALIVVGNEHRLADPEPLAKMLEACERAVSPETLGTIHQEAKRARYRFGIDTLLIITAMYAVLFGILRALNLSAAAVCRDRFDLYRGWARPEAAFQGEAATKGIDDRGILFLL